MIIKAVRIIIAQRFAPCQKQSLEAQTVWLRLSLLNAQPLNHLLLPRFWQAAVSGSLLWSIHCVIQFSYPGSKLSGSQ